MQKFHLWMRTGERQFCDIRKIYREQAISKNNSIFQLKPSGKQDFIRINKFLLNSKIDFKGHWKYLTPLEDVFLRLTERRIILTVLLNIEEKEYKIALSQCFNHNIHHFTTNFMACL